MDVEVEVEHCVSWGQLRGKVSERKGLGFRLRDIPTLGWMGCLCDRKLSSGAPGCDWRSWISPAGREPRGAIEDRVAPAHNSSFADE